jgi:hypothetical protein
MAKRARITKGLSIGLTHGLLIGVWGLLFWYASLLVLHIYTSLPREQPRDPTSCKSLKGSGYEIATVVHEAKFYLK